MTVARLLHDAGYATGGFGKWGLGNPGTSGVPEKEGFDLFFGYYDQVHAHDYYTGHLIRNSASVAIPENEGGKKAVYSHTLIAAETLKFIEQNKDRPFFCYAAWTPPHGDYVIPSDAPYSKKPWEQVNKNYAAMVALIDKDVGRVVQKLKDLGLEKNTLVIFSSDNGANAAVHQAARQHRRACAATNACSTKGAPGRRSLPAGPGRSSRARPATSSLRTSTFWPPPPILPVFPRRGEAMAFPFGPRFRAAAASAARLSVL